MILITGPKKEEKDEKIIADDIFTQRGLLNGSPEMKEYLMANKK